MLRRKAFSRMLSMAFREAGFQLDSESSSIL